MAFVPVWEALYALDDRLREAKRMENAVLRQYMPEVFAFLRRQQTQHNTTMEAVTSHEASLVESRRLAELLPSHTAPKAPKKQRKSRENTRIEPRRLEEDFMNLSLNNQDM